MHWNFTPQPLLPHCRSCQEVKRAQRRAPGWPYIWPCSDARAATPPKHGLEGTIWQQRLQSSTHRLLPMSAASPCTLRELLGSSFMVFFAGDESTCVVAPLRRTTGRRATTDSCRLVTGSAEPSRGSEEGSAELQAGPARGRQSRPWSRRSRQRVRQEVGGVGPRRASERSHAPARSGATRTVLSEEQELHPLQVRTHAGTTTAAHMRAEIDAHDRWNRRRATTDDFRRRRTSTDDNGRQRTTRRQTTRRRTTRRRMTTDSCRRRSL